MLTELDIVRVISDDISQMSLWETLSIRKPKAGNIATIVFVHLSPPAYELECVNGEGVTEWLATIPHEFVESVEGKEQK